MCDKKYRELIVQINGIIFLSGTQTKQKLFIEYVLNYVISIAIIQNKYIKYAWKKKNPKTVVYSN